MVVHSNFDAKTLAWAAIFFIQPFSAVYYPVDVLPPSVRWISWLLPVDSMSEGTRTVLRENRFDRGLMGQAADALAVWLVIAFALLFRSARRRGCCCRARSRR